MKVIRLITFEGTAFQLEGQLYRSLKDGVCDWIHPVKITIQTLHSDISDQERFGQINRTEAVEDYKRKPGDNEA